MAPQDLRQHGAWTESVCHVRDDSLERERRMKNVPRKSFEPFVWRLVYFCRVRNAGLRIHLQDAEAALIAAKRLRRVDRVSDA